MTGMDPVLNRRISSIFVSELENFKKIMQLLPDSENEELFQFNLHKIRPSMVIFEMETLIRQSESLLDKLKSGARIPEDDEEWQNALSYTDQALNSLRAFLQSL